MQTQDVGYSEGALEFLGYLAFDDTAQDRRPGVLVVHEGLGLGEHIMERARRIAELGYVGAGLLSAINKPMGTGGGNFSAGILGLTGSTIVVNARVVNSNGFKLGDYQITSVVTCS